MSDIVGVLRRKREVITLTRDNKREIVTLNNVRFSPQGNGKFILYPAAKSTTEHPDMPSLGLSEQKVKQQIRTLYLGHVTGSQPIRDPYFPYLLIKHMIPICR